MIDSSVSPEGASDTQADEVEIPVGIDTLAIDGANPQVGDKVDLKVSGNVTRVVNGVAFVKPETVNDQPLVSSPLKPEQNVSEGDRLRQLSQQVDQQGGRY